MSFFSFTDCCKFDLFTVSDFVCKKMFLVETFNLTAKLAEDY